MLVGYLRALDAGRGRQMPDVKTVELVLDLGGVRHLVSDPRPLASSVFPLAKPHKNRIMRGLALGAGLCGGPFRSPRNGWLQTPPGPEGSNGSSLIVCRGVAG